MILNLLARKGRAGGLGERPYQYDVQRLLNVSNAGFVPAFMIEQMETKQIIDPDDDDDDEDSQIGVQTCVSQRITSAIRELETRQIVDQDDDDDED